MTDKKRNWHVRNDFPTTGNQSLDEFIDLQIDGLFHNFDVYSNQLQGVRATLTRLHPHEHDELIFRLGEILSQMAIPMMTSE